MRDSEYGNTVPYMDADATDKPDTHVVVVRVTSVNTYATVVSADNDWEAVERAIKSIYLTGPRDTTEVLEVIKL